MFKIILHGMVIQTKDNNNRNALESSAKMLLTYHCYAVMVQVPCIIQNFSCLRTLSKRDGTLQWAGAERTVLEWTQNSYKPAQLKNERNMKVVRGKILKKLFSNYMFFLRKTGSLTQIIHVSSSWNRTRYSFPPKGLSANNTRFMEC